MEFKDGSNTREGYTYHEFPGSGIPAQRPHLKERAKLILDKIDVKGKRVLDLGCNVGGIAYLLAEEGALVEGVDYDSNSISIGNNLLRDRKVKGSVSLRVDDITPRWIKKQKEYDIALWLSQWQWFVKQHSLDEGLQALYDISSKAKVLVFESATDDGRASIVGATQDKVCAWLIKSTAYSDVRRYKKQDGWGNRDLFICSNPVFQYKRHRGVVVKRWGKDWVRKINTIGKLNPNMLRGIKFLKELEDTPIAPRLGRVGYTSFFMSYEGIPIKRLREEDIRLITESLRRHKIIHQDIRPNNLLWNGTNVVLIDYGWAIHEGEKFDYPSGLGGEYRCPNGFSDEYSLRKVKEELDESMP